MIGNLKNIEKYSNGYFSDLHLKKYISKGLEIYYKYFVGKYVYKLRKNPILSIIESHSTAESYLIYTEFSEYLNENMRKKFSNSLENTFIKLWDDKENYFYNNIKVLMGIKIYDKTDMIRWSDSWMLYAISKFIMLKKGQNSEI